MNSVVGPIFNIFKFINSAATVCEQWFLSLYSKFMWFYCSCVEKKKKKKPKTLKLKYAKCAIQIGTMYSKKML